MHEVKDNPAVFACGIGIMMHAHVLCRRESGQDTIVPQPHLIITGTGLLRGMVNALAIARAGIVGSAWIEPQRTGLRHEHDVAQVAVAGTAEMGV